MERCLRPFQEDRLWLLRPEEGRQVHAEEAPCGALKRWRTTQIWRSHNSTFELKPLGSTPTLVHAQVEHDKWCRFSNRNPGWACRPSKVFTLHRASFSQPKVVSTPPGVAGFPHCRPSDHSVAKQPLPIHVIVEFIKLTPRFSELTSLSQARRVTEVFLHMVYVEAEVLPGTHSCHRSVSMQFSQMATSGSRLRRHKSSRGMCSDVSRLPKVLQAETRSSLHGGRITSSTFSL